VVKGRITFGECDWWEVGRLIVGTFECLIGDESVFGPRTAAVDFPIVEGR
jgi:hypothetical protein